MDYPEYVTYKTFETLCEKIVFPLELCEDWEFLVFDSKRLQEFLLDYKNMNLDNGEKFILMIVIVSSFNAAIKAYVEDENIWDEIRSLLIQDKDIHEYTIIHWSCKDQPFTLEEIDGGFAITQHMLEVYEVCQIEYTYSED